MFKIECFDVGDFGIFIHGGAGAPASMEAEKASVYHLTMGEALTRGWKLLESGAHSLEAIMTAVAVMEESPLFNAGGPGAVLNEEGHIRNDAGVMCGDTLRGAGVADLKGVLHPSQVARLVMEKSSAVLICSEGAQKLAREHGVMVLDDENHYISDHRRLQLSRAKERDLKGMSTDHDSETEADTKKKLGDKIGTVGVVALDRQGNLCAVTSTGGRVNKPVGRVGDSAVPGAGYWADNESLACSATGVGEAFLMAAAAKHLAQSFLQSLKIETALEATLSEVERFHGDGGFICITKDRKGAWGFNTPAMFRGYKNGLAELKTYIE